MISSLDFPFDICLLFFLLICSVIHLAWMIVKIVKKDKNKKPKIDSEECYKETNCDSLIDFLHEEKIKSDRRTEDFKKRRLLELLSKKLPPKHILVYYAPVYGKDFYENYSQLYSQCLNRNESITEEISKESPKLEKAKRTEENLLFSFTKRKIIL